MNKRVQKKVFRVIMSYTPIEMHKFLTFLKIKQLTKHLMTNSDLLREKEMSLQKNA